MGYCSWVSVSTSFSPALWKNIFVVFFAVVVQQFVLITHVKIRWSAVHCGICDSQGWFPCLIAGRCGGPACRPWCQNDLSWHYVCVLGGVGSSHPSYPRSSLVRTCANRLELPCTDSQQPDGDHSGPVVNRVEWRDCKLQIQCLYFLTYYSASHSISLLMRDKGSDSCAPRQSGLNFSL